MGADVIPAVVAIAPPPEGVLIAFARFMELEYQARLYLFGSQSRGDARSSSDYDVVAVSDVFEDQSPLKRGLDRRRLWRRAGGWGIELDLHCLTEREFSQAVSGVGFLGQAAKRGELREVKIGAVSQASSDERRAG